MGSLFDKGGGLTNPGSLITDSNGQSAVGKPSDVLNSADSALRAKTQGQELNTVLGQGAGGPAANAQLPTIGTPSLQQAAKSGAQPGGENVMSPGLNKAGKLVTLLQGGLQGAMAGRAKSEETVAATGGRRSGGAGMGFEAGYELPWKRAGMQNQLEQQQAQTQMLKAQSDMVQTPYGPMPAGIARFILPAEIRAGASKDVQAMKGDQGQTLQGLKNEGGLQKQESANSGRLSVEQMKFAIQNGQVARVTDGVDPATGQPAKLAFNKMGQPMGVLPGSLPSSRYLPTESDTVEYREDSDGNIIALPKHTTRQPIAPGVGGSAGTRQSAPAGGSPRIVAQSKTPQMVTGTSVDGRQIAGTPQELRAAGALGVTKLEASDASKVSIARQLTGPGGLFDLADKDLAQFKPGELEGLSPRWNEFLAGKVGTDDPRYVALRTHVNGLLSTAMMQAHMGSKGGEHIQEHFQNLADAGKMSQETLKAALNAEKQYVDEKAMRPNGAPKAANKPQNVTHIWTPQGLQPAQASAK